MHDWHVMVEGLNSPVGKIKVKHITVLGLYVMAIGANYLVQYFTVSHNIILQDSLIQVRGSEETAGTNLIKPRDTICL